MASHLNKVLNPKKDSDFEHLTRFHLIGEIEAFLNSLKKEKSI